MRSSSDRPTSTTNELAKARNWAAAERTLMSWIQNCLALIGFGIAFDRIFTAIHRTFPTNAPFTDATLTATIGLSAILSGVFLLLFAIQTYLAQIKGLEQENYLHQPAPNFRLAIEVSAILIFGLMALMGIFVLMANA